MNDKYFLDTNTFVYTFDERDPGKRDRARALVAEALTDSRGVISYQVIQEFLDAALRKFAKPLTAADAERYLTVVLEPLCAVFASIELYHQAIDISERWKYSFYDSLIIASALQADCTILYSEDLQHGQKIGNLRILNPFVESPQN
ncbi:MAG: PIN domain-containing protein [Candidatus Aminicenantes bacterium]|nr:PIN domain-containing protein [Candidatus Aminicenantes bacterium]